MSPLLFVTLVFASNVTVAKTLVFQNQTSSAQGSSNSSAPVSVGTSASQPVSVNSVASSNINSELFFMVEQLQLEVRGLRGLVEEQQNLINRLQKDGKSRYKDLDSRLLTLTKELSKVESVSPTKPVVAEPKAQTAVVPVVNADASVTSLAEPTPEQRKAYQNAYAFIKDKKFNEAVDALHSFLEKYPEGELAGNAYYWLGEVYLVLPKLEQARQAFAIVVKSFPNHRKVADALFKLGVTFDRLQDPAQSERYLNQVQLDFPESTAAKLAKSYKINR